MSGNAEMSELYGENTNDTKIEENLEESLINQDDYKKLKQENECFRQEVYSLRFKLKVSDEVTKDLENNCKLMEKQYMESMAVANESRNSMEEKHTAVKEEYEKHIAILETNIIGKQEKIMQLQKELKRCKDLLNEESRHQIAAEEILVPHKEKIEKLNELVYIEKKNVEELKNKLQNMENINCHLVEENKTAVKSLMEKNKELEIAWKSSKELAANLQELMQSNVTPASDTCKGNSIFAEVEDRRRELLDKMKVLTSKYNEAKRQLNVKTAEIVLLRAEKSAMAKKWENDVIDTLQENSDLLDMYRKRIFDLETKLKIQMKNNDDQEIPFMEDDTINYFRLLLNTKKKEIKELNKEIEKQAMHILVQEEAKRDISRQLRYWQSKAKSLEAQNLAIKMQLETEQTNDCNKTLLEAIEKCKIFDDTIFEKTCDNLKLTPEKLVPKDNTRQENSTGSKKSPLVNSPKKIEKVVCFTTDTKDTGNKPLKKQAKQRDYPIISYTEGDVAQL